MTRILLTALSQCVWYIPLDYFSHGSERCGDELSSTWRLALPPLWLYRRWRSRRRRDARILLVRIRENIERETNQWHIQSYISKLAAGTAPKRRTFTKNCLIGKFPTWARQP